MSGYYIFNVSPDPVHDFMGQFGMFIVPGKKADEPYARFLFKDIEYLMDKGEDKYDLTIQGGKEMAKDMLSRNSKLGLFVAAEGEPTPEEVEAANARLFSEDTRRIAVADATWQKRRDRNLINDEARNAAKRRGVAREWMDATAGDVHKTCKYCGEDIKSIAIVCKHCHMRLDERSEPVSIPAGDETKQAVRR